MPKLYVHVCFGLVFTSFGWPSSPFSTAMPHRIDAQAENSNPKPSRNTQKALTPSKILPLVVPYFKKKLGGNEQEPGNAGGWVCYLVG